MIAEKFYILMTERHCIDGDYDRFWWEQREGFRWDYNGVTTYIHRGETGEYVCTEAKSGHRIAEGYPIDECQLKAKMLIDKKVGMWEERVAEMIKEHGLSPLYTVGIK